MSTSNPNILDLKSKQNEAKIVKIQAHTRGFLARKQLHSELQALQQQEPGALNRPSFTGGEPNYQNQDVQAIRA